MRTANKHNQLLKHWANIAITIHTSLANSCPVGMRKALSAFLLCSMRFLGLLRP